jgi:hypothetical protein
MIEVVEHQALKYACTYCVAGPGTWCRTISGAKATQLHYDRTDPIRIAWVDGWEEGKKEGSHWYEAQLKHIDRRSAEVAG